MNESTETTKPEMQAIFDRQKVNRHRVRATTAEERVQKLGRLLSSIENRVDELCEAVYADLHKQEPEVLLTEVYPVTTEIKHAQRHLKEWMRPEPVTAPLVFLGSESEIRREPKGTVLILAPWNYPFQLAIVPLVSAIAAGNCAIVKPSELSPNTSRFIHRLISSLFDDDEIAVIEGDHEIARFLVERPFDHVFFTGSSRIGKQVMEAAAKNLTSLTLELGGKSPVFLDESADLKEAAMKIAWGKGINAGQSCVAPDYVLVPEEKETRFIELLRGAFRRRYGDDDHVGSNPDYCRIINERHFSRIKALVDGAVRDGARLEMGGAFREEDRFISPTVVSQVPVESAIMQEEIFGPVLPVLPYRSRKEATELMGSRPRPLALYIFARNPREAERVLNETEAGDTVINDVVVHYGHPGLPFGGFNASGIGKAHGKAGFEAFSHQRSVMRQPKRAMPQLLYPPYTRVVRWLIRFTVKYF
jgi:aldehyde dehydrogenase (NAD+)